MAAPLTDTFAVWNLCWVCQTGWMRNWQANCIECDVCGHREDIH